jgi:hypothetical protein
MARMIADLWSVSRGMGGLCDSRRSPATRQGQGRTTRRTREPWRFGLNGLDQVIAPAPWIKMRTDQDQPVRLADYQPPSWLVDTVALDVSLHATATRVRATLKLRPNPAARAAAPLALDGDDLALQSIALDGAPLPAEAFSATPDRLTIAQPPQRPFTLEIETLVDPSANTQLSGLYRAGATYCTQCEAEGFRRITISSTGPT